VTTIIWKNEYIIIIIIADPSGCAIEGVGLMLLACWDYGFESRGGHGCLSFVSVVFCKIQVSASG